MINNLLKILLVVPLLLGSLSSYGFTHTSDSTEHLEDQFDVISIRWDLVAQELERYDGLGEFCIQEDYRKNVVSILTDIHHFDSLIYKRLKLMASTGRHSGEIRKTVKQIEELENEYGINSFTKFLKKECHDRKEVEKSRKESVSDFGDNSYDGQKHVVESTLHRYIHHVTHLVDHIRKHIHHLHVDDGI